MNTPTTVTIEFRAMRPAREVEELREAVAALLIRRREELGEHLAEAGDSQRTAIKVAREADDLYCDDCESHREPADVAACTSTTCSQRFRGQRIERATDRAASDLDRLDDARLSLQVARELGRALEGALVQRGPCSDAWECAEVAAGGGGGTSPDGVQAQIHAAFHKLDQRG